jgi:hypothetical protein
VGSQSIDMPDQNNDGKTPLQSWKKIATYLKVTVRTAQKWETERGLPVERHPRSGVIAYAEDLEKWRSAGDGSGRRPVYNRTIVLALGLVALSLALVVAFFFRSSPGEPARCEWAGDQLQVLDRNSRVLWTVPARGADPDQFANDVSFDRSLIRDLDGDGSSEILANFRPGASKPSLSRVACFERDGRPRWEFRPGAALRVEGSAISRDYLVHRMAVTCDGKASRLVVAANHRGRRLSQIGLLDGATGQLLAEYWHPGWATHILCADLDRDSNDEVIVAEVENATPGLDSPAIVWLDLVGLRASRASPGGLPQLWSESEYCVFPRPDLCGLFTMSTYEVDKLRETAGGIEAELVFERGNFFYLFDRSFKVIEFRASDLVYHYHDWAFRQKLLDHGLDKQEMASWAQVRCSPRREARLDIVRVLTD